MTLYRFLLIDDDPDEHLIFSMAFAELQSDGYCNYYLRFQDAIDAYTSHKELAPDFIVLGCGIPTPETENAIDKLNQTFQHAKTTVLLYSAYENVDMSSIKPNMAGCPFLPKLTSNAELSDALKNLVHNIIRTAQKGPDVGSNEDMGTNFGFIGGQA